MEPARSRQKLSSSELGSREMLPTRSTDEPVWVRRVRSRTSALPNASQEAVVTEPVRGRAARIGALETDEERRSGVCSPGTGLSLGDPSRAGKADAYEWMRKAVWLGADPTSAGNFTFDGDGSAPSDVCDAAARGRSGRGAEVGPSDDERRVGGGIPSPPIGVMPRMPPPLLGVR